MENFKKFGFSVIQVETKSTCNMACEFCPYPIRDDKGITLESDHIFSVINQIDPVDGFEYLTFSHFNEPLLDSRIYNYIDYAQKKKIPLLIITNGLLLNRAEVREKLIGSPIDRLKLSLQTINPDTFNRSRGINLDYNKYIQCIYKFLSERVDEKTIIDIDIGCNFQTFKSLAGRKLLGIPAGDPSVENRLSDLRQNLLIFLKGLSDYDGRYNATEQEVLEFIENTSTDYIQEEGLGIGVGVRIKIKPFSYGRAISKFMPAIHSFSCHNRILGILASGSVAPCCLAYNGELSLGNIKEDTIEQILARHEQFFSDLRTKSGSKNDYCRRCFGQPTRRGQILMYLRQKFNDNIIGFNSRGN